MATQKPILITIKTLTVALVVMGIVATKSLAQQNQPMVYGSQLMTQQERMEYRQQIQNAKSAKEREKIRADHHQKMLERAKEKGVKLPQQPPLGSGMGPGQGGQRKGGGKGGGGG